jgi:hypothetical protein
VDIWRCIAVALVSWVAMIFVGLLLLPLALIPLVNVFVGSAVLLAGTAIAAKIVLSCDWKPAWIIGATVAVLNALLSWLLG